MLQNDYPRVMEVSKISLSDDPVTKSMLTSGKYFIDVECSRCEKNYLVKTPKKFQDFDKTACVYHEGRLLREGNSKYWSCCNKEMGDIGCAECNSLSLLILFIKPAMFSTMSRFNYCLNDSNLFLGQKLIPIMNLNLLLLWMKKCVIQLKV